MADELGQAVLKLALDTQELTVGLSAVERLVNQRVGKIQSNIAKVGKEFVIELQPTSVSRLEKFIDATRLIESQLLKLKNKPISIADPGLGVISKDFKDFAQEAVNTGKNLGNTEVVLRNQASALRALAANLKAGTTEYINLTQAAAKAQQKLDFRQFKEIEAVSKLFKLGPVSPEITETFKGTDELLAFSKSFKQTPAAINLYIQALRQALAVTELADPNFNALTAQITAQERALSKAAAAAERYRLANRPRIGFGGAPPVPTGFAAFSRRATQITEQTKAEQQQAADEARQQRRDARLQRVAALRRRRARGLAIQRGLGGAVSSGLVGGAFPLLFGQGIGAAAGGLAFGAGGGAISALGGPPGLGFGASLVGTILGSAFDEAINKAKTLAAALDDPISNFDALRESALLSSRAVEKQAKALIDSGRAAEASALILQDLSARFGDAGNAKELLDATDTINRQWSELSTTLGILSAGPLSNLADLFTRLLGPAQAQLAFEQRVTGLKPEQAAEARKFRESELRKVPSFANEEQYKQVDIRALQFIEERFGKSKAQLDIENKIKTSKATQLGIDSARVAIAREEDRILSLQLQKRQTQLEEEKALQALGDTPAQAAVDKIKLDTKVKLLEIERQISEEVNRRDEKQKKAAQDLQNLRLQNIKFLGRGEKQDLIKQVGQPAIQEAQRRGVTLRSFSDIRDFAQFLERERTLQNEAGPALINSNQDLRTSLESTAEVVRGLVSSVDTLSNKEWNITVTVPGQNSSQKQDLVNSLG